MKFNRILDQYNPLDVKSHGVLKFFAQELEEYELKHFLEAIFNTNSWVISTEISKQSNFSNIQSYTEQKFKVNFKNWVDDRLTHFRSLNSNVKNPYLPFEYKSTFTDALISIKNLDFSDVLMTSLNTFFVECNPVLLKQYLEHSTRRLIEEYDENELETFLSFFLEKESLNYSKNTNYLIHFILSNLAYSTKVFSLSNALLKKLEDYSSHLVKDRNLANDSNLTSILLVELISKKSWIYTSQSIIL